MSKTVDRRDILITARDILRERQWCRSWSYGQSSPLNLRSAVSLACTKQVGGSHAEWYECYLDAIHALTHALGRGITEWEFQVTVGSVVDNTLTEVINRLENTNDIPRRAGRRTRPSPAGL